MLTDLNFIESWVILCIIVVGNFMVFGGHIHDAFEWFRIVWSCFPKGSSLIYFLIRSIMKLDSLIEDNLTACIIYQFIIEHYLIQALSLSSLLETALCIISSIVCMRLISDLRKHHEAKCISAFNMCFKIIMHARTNKSTNFLN